MTVDTAFDDADLNGFVDGRIEPARAAALAESLASDPEARARIDGWKRQNESLRTLFASVLFEPVPVRLLPGTLPARAAGGEASKTPAGLPPSGRLAGVVATTSIGMALVGFALGALAVQATDRFGLPWRIAPAGPQDRGLERAADRSLAERAAEAHRTFLGDAARPVELTAAEEPKLLRWLQHRLGSSLRIPDLGRQGWWLVGGRIVPGPRDPVAFLVYGNGPDRLGLAVSRAPAAGATAVFTTDGPEPVGVATWGDDTFGYALTSDRGGDWLERNAGPLRDSVRAQASGDGSRP